MHLEWFGPFNSGAAVGNNGVATANNTTSIKLTGKVHAIYVKYNDTPPAGTTDVTVATLGTSPSVPAISILTLTDQATNVLKYPRVQVHNTAGTALTMEGTEPLVDKIAIDDKVKVTIDQANADDNVDVWICLERD